MALLPLMPDKAFSEDAGAIKINLPWMDDYSIDANQNAPNFNLQLDPLGNLTYKCGGQAMHFTGGRFYKKFKDYAFYAEVTDGAYGYINGDDKEDAVVILQTSTGGSGTFVTMAVIMNQKGKYINTDCIEIGDREAINTIQIKSNKVTLDMLLHLSGEPYCCPNSPFTFTFNISNKGRILNARTFGNISLAANELSLGYLMGMRKPGNVVIAYYNKAIRLYPQYTQAYLYRANTLKRIGRFSQAIRDYDSVLRLDPTIAEAYGGRAYCYIKLKGYNHAISDATQAIMMEPEAGDSYLLRGNANAHLGKYQEAISDYSLCIKNFIKSEKDSCNPVQNQIEESYLARAQLHDKLQDYPRAIADLSKIIGMKPPEKDKNYICFNEVKYKSLKKEADSLREKIYQKLAKDKSTSGKLTK